MAAPAEYTGFEMVECSEASSYLGVESHIDWSLRGDHMNPGQLGDGRLGQPADQRQLAEKFSSSRKPAGASHVEGQVGPHQLVGRLPHCAAALHRPSQFDNFKQIYSLQTTTIKIIPKNSCSMGH